MLYGQIEPPKDVNRCCMSPTPPATSCARNICKGEGVYGCVSVDHDATGNAKQIVLAIAKAVGSTRAGVVEMSFQHETEGDNFEEQILYGGAIHLMKLCFNVMVENGYPPSFAYAKAIRSLRSVIDVMDENGIEEYLTGRCSRTCEFAVRTRGPRVINEAEMRKIFAETERGDFRPRLDAGMEPGHADAASPAPHGRRKRDGKDRQNLAQGIWQVIRVERIQKDIEAIAGCTETPGNGGEPADIFGGVGKGDRYMSRGRRRSRL